MPVAAPSLADRLLDRVVRHGVLLERHESAEVARMVAWLNRNVLPDLEERVMVGISRIRSRGHATGPTIFRLQRWHDLTQRLGALTGAARSEMLSRLTETLGDLARQEGGWNLGMLRDEVGRFRLARVPRVTLPAAHELRAIVTSRPFQGRVLRDWVGSWEASTRSKVLAQLRIGLVQGEDVEAIVRRIRGTSAAGYADGVSQISRREATTIVRTSMTHVASHAAMSVMQANRGLVRGWLFVAVLDGRTSTQCISLSGTKWPLGKGPLPPVHPNCRSKPAPLIVDEPDPADVDYGEWLARQPAATQDEILGVGRAQVFRRGVVPLRRFIDFKHRPISRDELYRLEARLAN